MDNVPGLALAVERIVGQPVRSIVNKHRCIIFLTDLFAAKVRRGQDVPLEEVSDESRWLLSLGLEATVSEVGVSGHTFSILVMPRLIERDCAGRKLAVGTFNSSDAQAIFNRLNELSQCGIGSNLSRQELRQQLIRNFDRQVLLGPTFGELTVWRRVLGRLLRTWSDGGGSCGTAAHRNAFSPNVFLDSRRGVMVLDPRCKIDTLAICRGMVMRLRLPWI